jgi:hypothetical protein
MAASITSAEFTDDTRLFYSRQSANTWRLGLRCPSAGASAEGAVLKCTHVADITTIDSVDLSSTIAGSNADDQTTIAAIGASYSEAEVKAALQVLAEKINFLTFRLEQAGIMSSS